MSQQRAVSRLYRRALRAAARCPEPSQQRMLRDYIRLRAARERAEVDPALIKRRMEEALDEIERMEYYQAARSAEERGSQQPVTLAACECGATLPATAKFCSQCGRARAEGAS